MGIKTPLPGMTGSGWKRTGPNLWNLFERIYKVGDNLVKIFFAVPGERYRGWAGFSIVLNIVSLLIRYYILYLLLTPQVQNKRRRGIGGVKEKRRKQ